MPDKPFKMDDVQEDNIVPQSNSTLRVVVGLVVVFLILTIFSIAHLSKQHHENRLGVQSQPGEPTPPEEPRESDIVHLDEYSFAEKTASGVVLVDFYADWCGPCKRMEPALEQIATQFKEKAVVAKVNGDFSLALKRQYGVNAYPTLILLKDGEEVGREVGLLNSAQIALFLETAIKSRM